MGRMRKEYLTNYNEATWHTNKLNAKSREFMEEIRSGKYDIPRDKKCRKVGKKGTYIRFYTATGEKVEIKAKEEENERTQQADAGGKGIKAFKRLRQHFQLRRDKRIRDNAAGEQDFGAEKARH